MKTRTRTTYVLNPDSTESDDKPPTHFSIIREQIPERQRREGESWFADKDSPLYPSERSEVAKLSRNQLADFIGDAVSWLAYTGEK
jgi:hypothetical protein